MEIMHHFPIIVLASIFGFLFPAGAQTIKNASYSIVAHIKDDGTIQDAAYRTIGHAPGIPLSWAAYYFFFSEYKHIKAKAASGAA